MASPEPQQRRVRNPQLTRSRLIQATIGIASEKGELAMSVSEVAERARVSRRAAYVHFRDREHLLAAAKAWVYDQLGLTVRRFADGATLEQRIFRTAQLVLQNPEASRFVLIDALSGVGFGSAHPLYRLVAAMYEDRRNGRRVRQGIDAETLIYIHFSNLAALLMLRTQHAADDIDQLAARYSREWSQLLEHGIFG